MLKPESHFMEHVCGGDRELALFEPHREEPFVNTMAIGHAPHACNDGMERGHAERIEALK
jgi:hypothetical protein